MVITKKPPLSILRHLRVVNSAFLKQRFDGCLFQISFYRFIFKETKDAGVIILLVFRSAYKNCKFLQIKKYRLLKLGL